MCLRAAAIAATAAAVSLSTFDLHTRMWPWWPLRRVLARAAGTSRPRRAATGAKHMAQQMRSVEGPGLMQLHELF